MSRKLIYDYCLKYLYIFLNWIDYFTFWVEYCNFLNLYGRYVLQHESILTIFSLLTQQIEVRLLAINIEYLSTQAYTPFHFSFTVPLTSFFRIASLQVNKEKLLFYSFTLFPWLCVSMLLENKIVSCLHCIDIYDDDCM